MSDTPICLMVVQLNCFLSGRAVRYQAHADLCLGQQRANILKEVQIMRQLDHPNIVKLVDFSESRQYYYIVLELCPGGELFHQIVRLTYFSEDLSRHVIVQVAKALEYLHEDKGVVHR
jgi:serine/threonine-protein kinase RCK2